MRIQNRLDSGGRGRERRKQTIAAYGTTQTITAYGTTQTIAAYGTTQTIAVYGGLHKQLTLGGEELRQLILIGGDVLGVGDALHAVFGGEHPL